MQLDFFTNGSMIGVMLNHSILTQLSKTINFKKVTVEKDEEKKQYDILIDKKLKISLNPQITKDDKAWNYINLFIKIDSFVKDFKCSFNCKKLYQKGKWYALTYKTQITYELQREIQRKIDSLKRIAEDKSKKDKSGAKKAVESTSLGFIKAESLDGMFYCPDNKEYLADINKFNDKILKAALPEINKVISKAKTKINEIKTEDIPKAIGSYESKSGNISYQLRIKFQECYMKKKDREDGMDIDEFIVKKKDEYEGTLGKGLYIFDEDFKPCKDFKKYEPKLYYLAVPSEYIDKKLEQDYDIQLFTTKGIIHFLKDMYPNNQFQIVIQPKFQFGQRSKDDKKYTKFDVADFILAISKIGSIKRAGSAAAGIKGLNTKMLMAAEESDSDNAIESGEDVEESSEGEDSSDKHEEPKIVKPAKKDKKAKEEEESENDEEESEEEPPKKGKGKKAKDEEESENDEESEAEEEKPKSKKGKSKKAKEESEDEEENEEKPKKGKGKKAKEESEDEESEDDE